MELGITFSGVPIHSRMVGVNSTPSTDSAAPMAREKITVVWMARSAPSRSRAPQKREMMTLAPMNTPWKKPMSRWHRLPEELTAARAASPQ